MWAFFRLVVTHHIQRMGRGNVFAGIRLSVHLSTWRGVPHPHPIILPTTCPMSFVGGYPMTGPRSLLGGYPSDWAQVPSQGAPQDRSTPLGKTGVVPQPGLGSPSLGRTSHVQDMLRSGLGYPPGQDWGPLSPGRTSRVQDTLRSVRLSRFQAGRLSCYSEILTLGLCTHHACHRPS